MELEQSELVGRKEAGEEGRVRSCGPLQARGREWV